MSEEIRWAIKLTGGNWVRGVGETRYDTRQQALYRASDFSDSAGVRIVRIRRKKKPRVVAKHVMYGDISGSPAGAVALEGDYGSLQEWYSQRIGKHVRVILEELADE